MNHHPNQPHDTWADHYDCAYKLTSRRQYQQLTLDTLNLIQKFCPPPARVVDYGAGTGRLAIPLAQLGYRVTAVEACAEMCRVLKAKAAAGVEGAVAEPCAVCQQATVPQEQRKPVEVSVQNQDICQALDESGFDLGLCVFTVPNYLVEEAQLRRFAAVAAQAIKPDGKLLVSFVDDMQVLKSRYDRGPLSGESEHCKIQRRIEITTVRGRRYDYDEKTSGSKNGAGYNFTTHIPLREWTKEEVVAAVEAAGFRQEETDPTNGMAGLGEVYLRFVRVAAPAGQPVASTKTPKKSAKEMLRRLAQVRPAETRPASAMLTLRKLHQQHLYGEALIDPPNLEQRLRLNAKLQRGRRKELEQQRQARELLSTIQDRNVFFNPEPTVPDWAPLHRLTHLCDTFVFCGPLERPERIGPDTPLPGTEWKYLVDLDSDTLRDLGDQRLLPWAEQLPPHFRRPSPWGKYGQLVRRVGNVTRELHFLYLGIEGVTLFFNLFAMANCAPRILWLCEYWGNWTDFYDYGQPLGQLVRQCRIPPEILMTYNVPISSWPYKTHWQTFTQWMFTTSAYVRNTHINESVHVRNIATPGHRVVRVRRGTLTAGNEGNAEAVFTHDHRQPAWPQGTRLLLNTNAVPAWAARLDPQPVCCDLRRLPMRAALQKLTETCAQNQIKKVACIGFGFEDEGPELEAWRQEAGYPLEITIYCQNPGDVFALGPYADAIE